MASTNNDSVLLRPILDNIAMIVLNMSSKDTNAICGFKKIYWQQLRKYFTTAQLLHNSSVLRKLEWREVRYCDTIKTQIWDIFCPIISLLPSYYILSVRRIVSPRNFLFIAIPDTDRCIIWAIMRKKSKIILHATICTSFVGWARL